MLSLFCTQIVLGEGYSAACQKNRFRDISASIRRSESSELGLLLERDPPCGGCRAGNQRNRSADTRGVRLSPSEV
eukprot:741814-Pyramimonas_sp.AAC.1